MDLSNVYVTTPNSQNLLKRVTIRLANALSNLM